MAKIYYITKNNRGIATCSKCGKRIKAGEKYLKATPYRRKAIIRCVQCGIQSYETSNSSYIRQIGKLKSMWRTKSWVWGDDIQDIIDDLDSIKCDIENNLFNMPEQFQDYSVLQDRLQSLENCIDELQSIDVEDDYDDDDDDDIDNTTEINYKNDVISALSYL